MMDEAEELDEHGWPENTVQAGEVRTWIASALPGKPDIVGPILVHQAKEWGVTASFAAVGVETREVVFKAAWHPLFRDAPRVYALLDRHCPGRVPELLAETRRGAQTWTLFAAFDGVPVEEVRTPEALAALARTAAEIQATIAALPAAATAGLPRTAVAALPTMCDAVLRDLRERQRPLWQGQARDLAEQFAIPADAVERLEAFRPAVAEWTRELAAAPIPVSIDHVDLQWGNAVLQPDGSCLIFDWEEATLSCPLFSLDRLLNDARELDLGEAAAWAGMVGGPLYTPTEAAVRDAYLDALPWGTREERARSFELAMRLAPIKTAYEGIQFADALGWGGEPSLVAAWTVGRMLARWPDPISAQSGRDLTAVNSGFDEPATFPL